MTPIAISALVFALVFGGALVGMRLRRVLPEHHRSAESKELVRSAIALISTMSALVLGLLVASAKGRYDSQKEELTSMAAQVLLLDRVLAMYGPESASARASIHDVVSGARDQIWNGQTPTKRADNLYEEIERLSPKNVEQQALKSQASSLVIDLAKTRFLMLAQTGSSVSTALLIAVVFWLTITFISLGLFTQRNVTVTMALFVCALSVAGAIFLILEMDHPFEGLIRIPDTPVRQALEQLGH